MNLCRFLIKFSNNHYSSVIGPIIGVCLLTIFVVIFLCIAGDKNIWIGIGIILPLCLSLTFILNKIGIYCKNKYPDSE
jgi:hypothetical protein